LTRRTQAILKSLGLKKAGLSILLTTDAKIRTINRKHLNHDWATDVISFGAADHSLLGDLVISLDTTKRQAKEYDNSFEYELAFYICHGILHLMGYEDSTKAKREKMHRKQKQILEKTGMSG
jgi:probable rRNA maturation factor